MLRDLGLTATERRALRRAGAVHPDAQVRRRVRWLLALDRGASVAAIARASGVSRPTVYRYARLWLRYRDPSVLSPSVARWLAPWRSARR